MREVATGTAALVFHKISRGIEHYTISEITQHVNIQQFFKKTLFKSVYSIEIMAHRLSRSPVDLIHALKNWQVEVDRIIVKEVPVEVERLIEKIVVKEVPVPVEKIVEKIVEVLCILFYSAMGAC